MRKLAWVLVGVMMMVTLFSTFLNAAEFGTDKSITRMSDEKFQTQQTVAACKMLFGDNETGKRCAVANMEAYYDVINTLEDMFDAKDSDPAIADTYVYNAMVDCMFDTIEKYWMPNYNTAPWLKVRNEALSCMKQKAK